MRYISTLKEGQRVSDIYLCKTKTIANTKNGKTYYSLTLQDKTGMVNGKIWDLNNAIHDFEALDYIAIDADVTIFMNALQLNIRRLRVAEPGEYDAGDYMPVSPYNRDEMYAELIGYVNSIGNEWLRSLTASFFKDEDFARRFKLHSAAKTIHHSFVGGLLQHTLRVTQMCDYYSSRYPLINRDLLITGAMLHDVGKLEELSAFPENDYTDEGQLVGHIVIGYRMIYEHIKELEGFPKELASQLEHMILAHHGELEYGSPKKPATLEAVALHYADDTDAKFQIMSEVFDTSVGPGEWLGYNKILDSNVRKTTL
jgi:3'-5' exoribonuclease